MTDKPAACWTTAVQTAPVPPPMLTQLQLLRSFLATLQASLFPSADGAQRLPKQCGGKIKSHTCVGCSDLGPSIRGTLTPETQTMVRLDIRTAGCLPTTMAGLLTASE